jgi:hypothetical protein
VGWPKIVISLTINDRRISVLLSGDYEIWDNIVIQKAHSERDGQYIGLREGLLNIAKKRGVRLLNIKVLDPPMEFSISPEDFIKGSKIISRPSKFSGFFRIYMLKI